MLMPKTWIAIAAACLVAGGAGGAVLSRQLSRPPVEPGASAAAPAASLPYQDAPSAPAGGDIGPEGAKAAALAKAGLTADAVSGMIVESDWENGLREYEVTFWDDDAKYEYTVDAAGKVLKTEQESLSKPAPEPAVPESAAPAANLPYQDASSSAPADTDVGPEGAKAAALADAGLTADAVSGLTVESDWEDGLLEYEVEFRTGDTKYDYTVDAAGCILKVEKETWTAQPASSASAATAGGDIGEEAAKAAALAHAGLTADAVTDLLVESDWDDGLLEYEVEFWNGYCRHHCTIDGSNGCIRNYTREDCAPYSGGCYNYPSHHQSHHSYHHG